MTKPACCGTGVQGPEGAKLLCWSGMGGKVGWVGKWDGLESGKMGSLRIHSFANFLAQSIFVVSLSESILKAAGVGGWGEGTTSRGIAVGCPMPALITSSVA